MNRKMLVLFAVVAVAFFSGCNLLHDDEDCKDDQTKCEQVCFPCDGEGSAKVYSGEFPRAGIFGAPLHYSVCAPTTDAMTADHVCFQDTGHAEDGVQPVCFFGCGEDRWCERPPQH